MRILICHERFVFRYGVDRVLLSLAGEFRDLGHHVTLAGMRFDESATTVADRLVRVPGTDPYIESDLRTFEWLEENWVREFVSAGEPDIVFVAGWPFFSAIPFFEGRGCWVVFSDHGITPENGLDESDRKTLALLQELKATFVPRASGLIAVSRFILETQSLVCARREQIVDVVLNGVDHVRNRHWGRGEADAADHGRRDNSFKLIFLGRFEPGCYKQSEFVFELERRLRAWMPDCWLGVLASRAEVEAAAGGPTRVIGLGHLSDAAMYATFLDCDAAACLSAWEGFNLPLAEAQALGRPCLVFDCGAHREVVASPWLLCRGLDEMEARIRSLAERSAPAAILDGSCFESYATERTWGSSAKQYMRAFERVIEGRPERALPWVIRRSGLFVVDVTNSCRDPANSGVIRVTRRLTAELQQYHPLVFVIWDRAWGAFRFPSVPEFAQLGAFQGPSRPPEHPLSTPERIYLLPEWLGTSAAGGWLLLPELRHREDLWPILAQARALELRTACIFYDAIPLLRPDFVVDPIYRDGHADYMKGISSCDVNIAISRFSEECLRDFWTREGLQGFVRNCLLPGGFPGRRPVGRLSPDETSPPRPFILCVSTIEPRKNHRRLVEAFLRAREIAARAEWELRLVGNSYAGAGHLQEWLDRVCRENDCVKWLGIVPDEELARLYQECEFTAYPSEIEGFGLPVVESMWYGRPCLCHQGGVMAELAAGGGCRTTDVTRVDVFAQSMSEMMMDRELRERLAGECRARTIRSWSDYAAGFLVLLALTRRVHLGIPWQAETGEPDGEKAGSANDEALVFLLRGVIQTWGPRRAVVASKCKAVVDLATSTVETVFRIGREPERAPEPTLNHGIQIVGDVSTTLPVLLNELEAGGMAPELICLDGAEAGLLQDVLLRFRPPGPCRLLTISNGHPAGAATPWSRNPYVRRVHSYSIRTGTNDAHEICVEVAELNSAPRTHAL